jgi:hypothetical protein
VNTREESEEMEWRLVISVPKQPGSCYVFIIKTDEVNDDGLVCSPEQVPEKF